MLSQMNIPKLRKEKNVKTYHGYKLEDDYAYVDQPNNILEVLKIFMSQFYYWNQSKI